MFTFIFVHSSTAHSRLLIKHQVKFLDQYISTPFTPPVAEDWSSEKYKLWDAIWNLQVDGNGEITYVDPRMSVPPLDVMSE